MSNKFLVMNTMNVYFPFMIAHVKKVIYNTLDGVSDFVHPISHTSPLVSTSSDGSSQGSHIHLTHARLANSGYMVDVLP
jgi:hypothetical protein